MPPVDLRAVCLVRAIANDGEEERRGLMGLIEMAEVRERTEFRAFSREQRGEGNLL